MTSHMLPRTGAMSFSNNMLHDEPDEVHTPPSDYSDFGFAQGSGVFSLCQTGPADLVGTCWDSTVEGQQNFQDIPDHCFSGAAEEYVLQFGQQVSPKPDAMDAMDATEDGPRGWPAAPPAKALKVKAEPIRPGSSLGSSHRSVQTTASQRRALPHVPRLDVPRRASSHSRGVILEAMDDAMVMDVPQYLAAQGIDTMPVLRGPVPAGFFPGIIDFGQDMSLTGDLGVMGQHVNPQVFDPAALVCRSPGSWASLSPSYSRESSPALGEGMLEDVWSAGPTMSSPTDSHTSGFLTASPNQSPRLERNIDAAQLVAFDEMPHGLPLMGEEVLPLDAFDPSFFNLEGDSARDHWLYKKAEPKADGLYHCPWEAQGCAHKAEKLKCNYDKFVDSHLKPYRCKVEGCQTTRFSSTACLLRHEREAHAMHGHGEKPFRCPYDGCERALPGQGFPRQWNLRDHMKRVHHDHGATSSGSSTHAAPVMTSSSTIISTTAATATTPTTTTTASPSSSTSATVSSNVAAQRGRKRKSESQEKVSRPQSKTPQQAQEKPPKLPGRKSSTRSSTSAAVASAAPAPAPVAPVREPEPMILAPIIPMANPSLDWREHYQALQALLQGCGYLEPEDPASLRFVRDAQRHLLAMGDISQGLAAGPVRGSFC